MFSRLREPGPSRLASKRAINAYRRRSDAVYLVSFPRTGSHWLRMMCEQYAQRPTLVRAFYPHDNTDYLFMHIHDVDLDFSASNVIYLYRDPVETVYSMLKYAQASGDDQVRLWSDRYASHLRKWLLQEDFPHRKAVVRYEDLPAALHVVVEFLHVDWDPSRFESVKAEVTRGHVSERTVHDPQVVSSDPDYELQRSTFRQEYSDLVLEVVLSDDRLRPYFA